MSLAAQSSGWSVRSGTYCSSCIKLVMSHKIAKNQNISKTVSLKVFVQCAKNSCFLTAILANISFVGSLRPRNINVIYSMNTQRYNTFYSTHKNQSFIHIFQVHQFFDEIRNILSLFFFVFNDISTFFGYLKSKPSLLNSRGTILPIIRGIRCSYLSPQVDSITRLEFELA